MGKRKRSWSIRNGMLTILIVLLVPVSICLMVLSLYTNRKLRFEVVQSNMFILQKEVANMDEQLRQTKNFLANLFVSDAELNFLKHPVEEKNMSNYIYKVRQKLINSQSEGGAGEIYFLLLEDVRYSTFTYMGDYTGTYRISAVSWLNSWDWQTSGESMTQQFIQVEERWFELLAFHDSKVCVGCLISVDRIMEMAQVRLNNNEVMSIVNADGVFMAEEQWMTENNIGNALGQDDGWYTDGKMNQFVVMQCSSSQLPGKIMCVLREDNILGKMKPITLFLQAVAIIMLCLIPLTLAAMHRVLFVPLNRLKDTICSIKAGGMENKVDCVNASREMREVYELFNEMMEQIRHFKICYYEEELKKKDYQLQYFSLQVKPHFYMNSLKCLYALAQKQEYRKVQDMILTMSEYYQQITYDNQSLITVASELEHVSLYMDIRQMGVENEIQCNLFMDNRARKINIPVLSIQTFVENSIKYAMVYGQELRIDIKVNIIEQKCGSFLDICVTDNGPGYSQDIIRAINQEFVDSIDGHVGLTNLWNRLNIIYNGDAFMAISNLPEGGAYSEILLPIRASDEDGKGKNDEYTRCG